jgi:hypothetical protein
VKLRACLFVIGSLALAPAAEAGDQPVDPALLEFLGSVDTEDKNWHEYLAHTDIDQIAKRSNARTNSVPPASSAPPAGVSPAPKDPPPSAPRTDPSVNPK